MRTLTDDELRRMWDHMPTERIKALGLLSGPGTAIRQLNAQRLRIVRLRELGEQDQ